MITTNSTNVTHIDTRRLSEAELDARIAELDDSIRDNRARHDEAFDRMGQLAHRKALSRASVIPLDSSLLARLIRWVRATLLSLRSPL